MIKIRPNVFETNSSSSDYYRGCDDPDYFDIYGKYGYTRHNAIIEVEWGTNGNDTWDNMVENDNIFNDIDKLFADYYEDNCSYSEMQDNLILFEYSVIVEVEDWEGGWDEPYPIFSETPENGIPLKNEEFPEKNKLLDEINKVFAKYGYSDVKAINLYSDEYDEEYLRDNFYD